MAGSSSHANALLATAAMLLVGLLPAPALAAKAGSLDRSFGHDGRKVTDFYHQGGGDGANAVAIQPNGKIVAAGWAGWHHDHHLAIARYRRNGRLDQGFSRDGRTIVRRWSDPSLYGRGEARALAIQPDGKIVAVGRAGRNFGVVRFNRDGELDRSFGDRGKVVVEIPSVWGPLTGAYDVAIQPDGKIVIVGGWSTVGAARMALLRFLPDGTPDPSFGQDGRVTESGVPSATATAVALQPDGKIVVSGTRWVLARFLPDGSIDPGFGDGGVQERAPFPSGPGSASVYANDLQLEPDGKIVVAGSGGGGQQYAFGVARYLPDGSLDSGFGNGGGAHVRLEHYSDIGDYGTALALQPNGRMVVAGTADFRGGNPRFGLARFTRGGSLDNSFAEDGRITTGFRTTDGTTTYTSGSAEDVAIQRDGKIVVVGTTGRDFAIARYLGTAAK
jgi:uncharacterized delta-60 repeat protein